MSEPMNSISHSDVLDTESFCLPRLEMPFSTAKSIFMKCAVGMCIVMQQQAGENNSAIVSLLLVPCDRIYSSAQTYHSAPLPVAPGLKAAGAYRPAAYSVHLIPPYAPKDQSPLFVIGKHAEKLVCVLHMTKREGVWGRGGAEERNKEDTKV